MKLPRALASAGRTVAAQPKLFLVAFTCLAAFTLSLHVRYPLEAGRDFHYHLMVAAINALPANDPVRGLYHSINPLDSNTLLYFVAYPFEKLTNPLRAFQLATSLLYYIGLPVSTAYALVRVGRSPWASLLTFPLVYGMQSHQSGYYPFLCAAFCAPLALAEFQVMHTTRGKIARNAGIKCAVITTGAFLGHAHIYAWIAILLGTNTLLLIAWKFANDSLLSLRSGLQGALSIALKSSAMIAPSGLVAAWWSWRVLHGAAAVTGKVAFTPLGEPTMHSKIIEGISYLNPTSGADESYYVAALGILLLLLLVFGERISPSLKHPPIFEVSVILTAISFIVLPVWYNGQTVATRQFDFTIWLLPLVLVPRVPRAKAPAVLVLAALFTFACARMDYIGKQLRLLNTEDYAGLVETAAACKRLVPHDHVSTLAFASTTQRTASWAAYGIQQSHETLAALCGLETPVYDTNLSPHNLLSLRYRGKVSAPITILETTWRWYIAPHILEDFDYILVKSWRASRDDDNELANKAELVAKYGDYQLWKSKKSR